MKVSIIIPVYNVELYIKECLESILNQTYVDLEVVLVDDGSTDKSGSICDEYALSDNRVRVIHKENEGPSRARNVGLEVATGDLICFVDSDDKLSLDAIELSVGKFQSYPDLDVLRFAICTFDENGNQDITFSIKAKEEMFSTEDAFLMWMRGEASHSMCAVYRSDVVKNVRFPVGYFSEDLAFKLRLFRNHRVNTMYLEKPVYYYRFNPNGTMQSRTEKMYAHAFEHWFKELEYYRIANPKRARQMAYGVFMQLKKIECGHRAARTKGRELQNLQRWLSPAYSRLKEYPIDWSVSHNATKDYVYWNFPWLWRLLRYRDWGVESIRK